MAEGFGGSGSMLPTLPLLAAGRGEARSYHLCLNPAAVEQDPERLRMIRDAGVDTVWLAGFFYGISPTGGATAPGAPTPERGRTGGPPGQCPAGASGRFARRQRRRFPPDAAAALADRAAARRREVRRDVPARSGHRRKRQRPAPLPCAGLPPMLSGRRFPARPQPREKLAAVFASNIARASCARADTPPGRWDELLRRRARAAADTPAARAGWTSPAMN